MMGYRIIYGKDKHRLQKWKKTILITVAACVILFVLSRLTDNLQIPEATLEHMVDSVRSGESIRDAITAFCREIIENAENVY